MAKFKVLSVKASKSRNGGANIQCQEIVENGIFGTCNGRQFIIQTEAAPEQDLTNQVLEMNLIFENVNYTFPKDGVQTTASYVRGIPC